MGKGRTPCCEKGRVKRGPWSQAEDLKLISFIHKHGHSNWRSLPKLAGLARCGKSCRLRWVNYLRPDLKRGNFTPEEEDAIIKLQQLLGNRWSKIASHFPGRTDNEIKNVWNTHLKKKKKKLCTSSIITTLSSSDNNGSSNAGEKSNSNNKTDGGEDNDYDDGDSDNNRSVLDHQTQLPVTTTDINTTWPQLTSMSPNNQLTEDLTTSSSAAPQGPQCFMDVSYGTIEISASSCTTSESNTNNTNNPPGNTSVPEGPQQDQSLIFPCLEEEDPHDQLIDLWDTLSLDYDTTTELDEMIMTTTANSTTVYVQGNFTSCCGDGDQAGFGVEAAAAVVAPMIPPAADSSKEGGQVAVEEDIIIDSYDLESMVAWPSSPYLL